MAFKMKGFSPFHQEEKKVKAYAVGRHPDDVKKVKAYRAGYHPDDTFKKSFRAARDAGVKKFTWRGKSYTTETKE